MGSCHTEYDEGHIIGLEINIFHQRLTIILKCGEVIQMKDTAIFGRSGIAGIVLTCIKLINTIGSNFTLVTSYVPWKVN